MIRARLISLLAIAACSPTTPENLTAVSVLKHDVENGCFAPITSVQPDPALQIPNLCASGITASAALIAGVDELEVVVDYGSDVHFSDISSTAIPAPTIAVDLDGQPSSPAISLSAPLPGPDNRVYFSATLVTPLTASQEMTIGVSVATGFAMTVPTTFTIAFAAPSVSVLKLSYTNAAPPMLCYLNLTSSTTVATDTLTEPLCATDGSAALVAGIDQVELVADYGSDIEFDAAANAPIPAFVLLNNGAATSTPITVSAPVSTAGGRVYFTGTFSTPDLPSNDITISATAAGGFTGLVPNIFSIIPPTPTVTLLELDPALGCYATIGDQPLPDASLNLPQLCAGSAATVSSTSVTAGVDVIGVLVDFDALYFATPSVVPSPTITTIVDGVPLTTSFTSQVGITNGHGYVFATLTSPLVAASVLAINVSLPTGFSSTSTTTLALVEPTPTLSIAECPASGPCSLVAGTGVATALVTVAGTVQRTVSFQSIVDGIPQAAGPTTTTSSNGVSSSATVPIPVPDVEPGATWQLVVTIGTQQEQSTPILLDAPVITALLSSGPTVTAGATVDLAVTAPSAIHVAEAIATTQLGGISQPGTVDITLDVVDRSAGTISGDISFAAPTTPGTWTIAVSVDGYQAQTIITTVQ